MVSFKRLFSEFFNIPEENVNDDMKYQDVEKWDSLAHLNFILKLEETYGIALNEKDMMTMNSIKNIKMVLKKHGIRV